MMNMNCEQKKSRKAKSKDWENNLSGTKKAVILSTHEKKVYSLLQQLNTIKRAKTEKRVEKRKGKLNEYDRKMAKSEETFLQHKKERRKRKFRAEGLLEKRKQQRT